MQDLRPFSGSKHPPWQPQSGKSAVLAAQPRSRSAAVYGSWFEPSDAEAGSSSQDPRSSVSARAELTHDTLLRGTGCGPRTAMTLPSPAAFPPDMSYCGPIQRQPQGGSSQFGLDLEDDGDVFSVNAPFLPVNTNLANTSSRPRRAPSQIPEADDTSHLDAHDRSSVPPGARDVEALMDGRIDLLWPNDDAAMLAGLDDLGSFGLSSSSGEGSDGGRGPGGSSNININGNINRGIRAPMPAEAGVVLRSGDVSGMDPLSGGPMDLDSTEDLWGFMRMLQGANFSYDV